MDLLVVVSKLIIHEVFFLIFSKEWRVSFVKTMKKILKPFRDMDSSAQSYEFYEFHNSDQKELIKAKQINARSQSSDDEIIEVRNLISLAILTNNRLIGLSCDRKWFFDSKTQWFNYSQIELLQSKLYSKTYSSLRELLISLDSSLSKMFFSLFYRILCIGCNENFKLVHFCFIEKKSRIY